MLGLTFAAGHWLWALGLAPLFWIWLARADARREATLEAEIGVRTARIAGENDGRRASLLCTLICAATSLVIVALAEPQHGPAPASGETPSLDILVCLDVSRSMRARDLEPDRLGFAHAQLERLATRAGGDRLGLVAFAGDAKLIVPLTDDLESFALLAMRTDELSVDRGGTDLATALSTALAAIESGGDATQGDTKRPSAILLLSDGEDLAGQGIAIAETCRVRGIPVHIVGLGSPLGSKIPILNDGVERFVVDANGQDVVSTLDALGLEALARASDGSFVSAAQEPEAVERLYDRELRALARASATAASQERQKARFAIPLLLAFFCALAAMIFGRRRVT